MYGLLLESIQFFVIQEVGEDVWHKILEHAGFKNMVFTTHNTYSDEIMVKLASSCCHVTKTKDFNQWMTFFGTCFVEFCSQYGYDNLLRVSGRFYRDFLHGIDNIHEIIRFSYPRLQSPSFLVLLEDKDGCVLLYQSKRRGFKHYVKGQLSQIAKKFYKVTVNITIIEEDFTDNICSVKFRLDFNNSVYSAKSVPARISGNQSFSSITGDTFLKVFPFCVIFNNQLIIKNVGHSMAAFLKGENLIGCHLREKFHIRRPLIPCIWNRILRFQRVIFELEYLQDDSDQSDLDDGDNEEFNKDVTTVSQSDNQKCLLRGEMKYIEDWDMVAFLCAPLLNNLKDLQTAGLYINDLNMFDMSRDMVMAGWQHASQLERSIEQQRDKSEKISENMGKIEEWKDRSESLLYSMIPESIAEELKSGMNPIDTCQLFDLVTIMFVYMVGFAEICTSSSPMEIVRCINNLFVEFDQIVDQYDVFKVETLGDAVYMVAGGVPDRNPQHAVNVATVALKLQERAKTVIHQIGKDNLNTRIGMHSGSVVGGVVGRRMPQYCLFGDTVNTASRMQTYSLPGRIHVSEPCNECLQGSKFVTMKRGKVNVKGKGEMQTYWLIGEEGDGKDQTILVDSLTETSQTMTKSSSYENALDLYGMHASTSYSQIELKSSSRRSSESQRSQLSLSVPHENKPSRSNNTSISSINMDARSEDLTLVLPVSKTVLNRSVNIEKESASRSATHPISFFLDSTDSRLTSDPVNEEDLGAVGGVAFDDNFETQDNVEASKQQKSYASVPVIQKRNSTDIDTIHGSQNNVSMFCPFLSIDSHQQKNTQVDYGDNQDKFQKSITQDNHRAGTDGIKFEWSSSEKRKTLPQIEVESDITSCKHASFPTQPTLTNQLQECPFRTVTVDYEQELLAPKCYLENDNSFHKESQTNNTIGQSHIGLTNGDTEKDSDHNIQVQSKQNTEMDLMTEKFSSTQVTTNGTLGLIQANKNCDGKNVHVKPDSVHQKTTNSFLSHIHSNKYECENTDKEKDPAIFKSNCDKKVQTQTNCLTRLNGSLPESDCEQNCSTVMCNGISLDREPGSFLCNGHGIHLTNLSKQISKNV